MRKHTLGLAIAGVLAPSLSYALGLGEITTNSALNQPLDAEIELVSTTPAEVKNVSVHLAPEAVFDQVGIERTAVLDQLRFVPTVENGVPVIKVTSPGSIQEPFVNFVIEVTWPKGKLLREYTVLLDPPVLSDNAGAPPVAAAQPVFTGPDTKAAEATAGEAETYPVEEGLPVEPVEPIASQPVEETAQVAEAAAVEEAETYPVEEAAPVEAEATDEGTGASVASGNLDEGLPPFVEGAEQPQPAAETETVEEQPVAEAQPEEVEPEEAPSGGATYSSIDEAPGTTEIFVEHQPTFVAEMPAEEAAPAVSGNQYKVARGDTLSGIAGQLRPDNVSLTRMMAALFAANKSAFVGSNINKLKSGFVLRIPDDSTLASMSTAKARSILAANGGSAWKKYRKALAKAPAPQEAMDAAKGKVPGINDLAEGKTPQAVEVPGGKVAKAETPGLEILAPEKGGKSATGTAEGKPGEIDAIKEQLASKTQEAAELKSRVEELEGLLAAKERLITLKDEQLAELQKSLGGKQAEKAEAKPESSGESEPAAAGGLLPKENAPAAEEAKPAAEETAKAASPEQPAAETEKPAAPEAEQAPAEQAAPAQEPAAEPEKATTEEAITEPEQAASEQPVGMLDDLKRNPSKLLLGGAGGLFLLALLAWFASRKKGRQDETIIDATATSSEDLNTVVEETEAESLPEHEVEDVATEYDNELPDAEIDDIDLDKDLVEEEAGSHSIQLSAEELDLQQEDLSSVDVAGAEDEVLSEANVYLAYGLHDQAIDLLKPAVEKHPERNDYQAKLLEAYHATSNRDAFAEVAEQLHRNLKDGDEGLWQRVIVMGKDLLPDHDLFKNADPGDLTIGSIRKDRPDLAAVDLDELPEVEDGQETVSISDDDIKDVLANTDSSQEFELPELDELNQSVATEGAASLAEADKSQEIKLDELGDLKDELVEGAGSAVSSAKDTAIGLTDKAKAAGAAIASGIGLSKADDNEEDFTFSDLDSEFTDIGSGVDQVGTKLDLAKAYIDMGDDEGAREALEEVAVRGNDAQKAEAKKLLEQLDKS